MEPILALATASPGFGELLAKVEPPPAMPATAFLFPGQGSQAPGMGRDLAENFSSARAVFDRADEALGLPLSKLCFEGPAEQLRLTENTQPAILTASIATLSVLRELGVEADYVAGHSLGEYSALVAAGSIGFEDAVVLVRKRGRYMQEAVPEGVGAMAALLGIGADRVGEVCAEAAEGQVVAPANLNSPSQVVIAGHTEAVKRAVDLAKRAGARRAVVLPVSAPFHCPLMEPALRRMEPELDAIGFKDLGLPLVNNWQARLIETGPEARDGLKNQIPNPVLWERSVRQLAALEVERYVEVGPGKVLTALLRGIDRKLRGRSAGNLASVEAIAS